MSTTPEDEEKEFLDLCKDGDLVSLEYLLEDNPDLVNSSNYGMIDNIIIIYSKELFIFSLHNYHFKRCNFIY